MVNPTLFGLLGIVVIVSSIAGASSYKLLVQDLDQDLQPAFYDPEPQSKQMIQHQGLEKKYINNVINKGLYWRLLAEQREAERFRPRHIRTSWVRCEDMGCLEKRLLI